MMTFRPLRLGMLLIFFFAMIAIGAIPGNATALSNSFGDKFLHLLAYGFMTFLCFRALNGRRLMQSLISLSIIGLLGLVDEWTQSFLPYRNASLLDWCFDIAAAGIVLFILNLYQPAPTGTS